jgi:hypothetical protein
VGHSLPIAHTAESYFIEARVVGMWVRRHFHDRHKDWNAFETEAWSPGDERRVIIARAVTEKRILLSTAVNLMAFGTLHVPNDLESPAGVPLEEVARKRQAARALCEAARLEHIEMIGSPNRPGDSSDPIPAEYFDTPRSLGHENDSIETDTNRVPMDVYIDFRKGHHQSWYGVRLDAKSFRKWILPTPVTQKVRKREAVKNALEARGPVIFNGPCSKTLQGEIIDEVRMNTGLSVSDRFVRERFSEIKNFKGAKSLEQKAARKRKKRGTKRRS